MKPISKPRRGSSRPDAPGRALPEFAVSILIIFLIWLVAELILLPLSAQSFAGETAKRVTSIVATLFVVAVGSLLPSTTGNGRQAVKLLSRAFVKNRYPKSRQCRMQPVIEGLGWALLIAVLGTIFSSLVYWINAVLGGMVLFATVLAVFVLLLKPASSWYL
jgi:hypothetical protein